MSSKIYQLKQRVIEETPAGELPATIFGRLMVKTRIIWSKIKEDTEVSPEQFDLALKAVQDMFGKEFKEFHS